MNEQKSKIECAQCAVDVGTGLYLKICGEVLSKKIDCESLSTQFSTGKIDRDELFTKIKEAAHDEPDVLADLEEIESLAKTATVDRKPAEARP